MEISTMKSGAVIFLLMVTFSQGCHGSVEEYQLVTDLLQSYSINARPVQNISHQVTVTMDIALNQLIDLDERNEVVKLKVWMRYKWVDEGLQWNTSEYGGISSLRILPKYIWRPDITLYTDLREGPNENIMVYPVDIASDGSIAWNVPDIVHSTCRLNVTYFPWDEQRCPLKYGSWTYDGSKVDVQNNSNLGDITYFSGNGEWTLVAFPVKRHEIFYNCCENPYPDLTFYLIIRRKPLYYLYNLILPCVFLTATTVLVFYLPPESGEKVSLGVTVLLTITVFLLLVAETMPPQSESIPVIGQYFGATVIMLAMSTSLTVIVLNIHHRGMFGNEVPLWIRKLVLDWLARPLCLKAKIDANISATRKKKKTITFGVEDHFEENGHINRAVVMDDLEMANWKSENPEKNQSGDLSISESILTKIYSVVKDFSIEQRHKEKLEFTSTDWMLVAMVIDRFLLLVFFVLTIVVALAILTNHPSYVEGVYAPIED